MNWLSQQLIGFVLGFVTPGLKIMICESLKAWKVEADKTPNPWDNVIIELLATLIQCELE